MNRREFFALAGAAFAVPFLSKPTNPPYHIKTLATGLALARPSQLFQSLGYGKYWQTSSSCNQFRQLPANGCKVHNPG
jgi:hypothetical protein